MGVNTSNNRSRASSACFGNFAGVLLVNQFSAIQGSRANAPSQVGFLGQQHALDVGMLNDVEPAPASSVFAQLSVGLLPLDDLEADFWRSPRLAS
jgi:hypothetical protein